jgi:hypothetical protein
MDEPGLLWLKPNYHQVAMECPIAVFCAKNEQVAVLVPVRIVNEALFIIA